MPSPAALWGESAKDPMVKSLLLRLSSAMSTGEAPAEFMSREAAIQAETYANIYDRKLESLKKWTDGYIALMVSVALIIVVSAISTVIYDMGSSFVTGLVGVMILLAALGCWMIYRTAPKEVTTLAGPEGRPSQRLPRAVFLLLAPSALLVGALLGMFGMPIGIVMVAMGVVVLPIGIVSARFDSMVSKEDREIKHVYACPWDHDQRNGGHAYRSPRPHGPAGYRIPGTRGRASA